MSRPVSRLLVANRAEIAVRIMRSAALAGIRTVAVAPEDDAACAHVARADTAVRLPGSGPAAYLDVAAVVGAARETGCDALHPGYGFLAEQPALAAACQDAGITFVLLAFSPPGGPGVRVDTHAYPGYPVSPRYDSLLAKVVVSDPSGDADRLAQRAAGALAELVVEGVDTNAAFLRAVIAAGGLSDPEVDTTWVDDRLPALVAAADAWALRPAPGTATRSPGGTTRGGAPPGRTSTTCATRAASWRSVPWS